jgi:hypothetical protein
VRDFQTVIRLRSENLGVGLLFVAIALLACLAPAQGDTWWLLRAGRDIWISRTIPFTDTYSFTALGRFWWNHEWLSEAAFYAAFRLGGLPLLTALCAGAIVAAWALCWRMARGAFEWRFALVATCVAAAAGSWALRPQVLSMLLFVLICRALADDRRLVWVPVLVAVWVNLHGAAVLSLVAIAGAGAAATVVRRRLAWPFVWTFAGSALATGLSPQGFSLYPEIVRSLERSRVNQLIEWLPPGAAPQLWPFWLLAVAVPVTIIVRRRTIDERAARLLGIAVVLLPLAVRSLRNVQVFLLAAIPAVTSAWAAAWPVRVRAAGERERVNGAIVLVSAVLASVGIGLVWTHPPARLGWHPISPAAIDAVQACGGPIYNTYGDGGVLIWFTPNTRVFIDNRQDPYPDELLRLSKTLESDGKFEETFARYGIRCAALPPASLVTRHLLADTRWSVTHRDEAWVVLRLGK